MENDKTKMPEKQGQKDLEYQLRLVEVPLSEYYRITQTTNAEVKKQ